MLIMWRVFTTCTRCHPALLSLHSLLILCLLFLVYSLPTLCLLCLGYVVIPVQDDLWGLFARHMTMSLILLYLIYSQVSTVVRIRSLLGIIECQGKGSNDGKWCRLKLIFEISIAANEIEPARWSQRWQREGSTRFDLYWRFEEEAPTRLLSVARTERQRVLGEEALLIPLHTYIDQRPFKKYNILAM